MTDFTYNFEKLEVWKDSRRLVSQVYKIAQDFPSFEIYALGSQIRRAVVSVMSNISEGTSRLSDKEKIRFIEISFGSLMEVYCQMMIAFDMNYINEETLKDTKQNIDKIANKLNALRRSYEKRLNS